MKTPIVTCVAASLLLATSFVSAEETLPLQAVNRANEVIDAALEAYGGAEAIANLNSVARKSHFTTWATNQSRSPGSPWDENGQDSFSAVDFEGRPHDVVTLVMEVGPALSLYFDKETHLLSRSERVLPPFGQVDYRFTDYETVDGIPFSKTFKLFVNDQPNIYIDIHSTEVNQPVEKYAAVPETLKWVEAAPPQPTDVELQEIKEGVFLVGAAGTYAVFVEMGDHVIAVGGTAGIEDRIKALREVVKDKPIRYGVMTHHHNDHVLGVPAYQAEDATVLTVKEHEAVVRAAATDAGTLKLSPA